MIRTLGRWAVHRGNRAFTWLWWSQTISLFGSQVSLIAIPLLAAVSLGADAFQMGLLAAIETVPYLAFSIPAGLLADRVDRRSLLITSNLIRAALLLAIPAAAVFNVLSLPVLYVIAFGVGCASVVFDVAYQSYVPDVLKREELLAGNQRIELSESAARTIGPGVGGALVAAVGGAGAVVADAISYLVASLVLLGASRRRSTSESHPGSGAKSRNELADPKTEMPVLGADLDSFVEYATALEERVARLESQLSRPRRAPDGGAWAGLAIVMRDRALRDMAASTATFNLASSAILAVFLLFAATEVGMDAASIGLLYGAGNVGFVLGALAVGAVTARLGVGPTLVISGILGAVATVLLPFATGVMAVGFLFTGRFVGAFAIPLFNVNARALRQSRAPRDAQGRVNAVFRLIDWGTLPIGALLGGWVGVTYGVRATLILGGVLGVASAAWLVWSPLRAVRRLEEDGSARPAVTTARERGRWWLRPTFAGATGAMGWPLTITGRMPTIRWPWLAIAGVAVQVAILPPVGLDVGGAAPIIYTAATGAVLVCVLRNVRIPGLAILAAGGASNFVALVANGGYMPVSPEAARAVGHAVTSGYSNVVERADAVLLPLTDIIAVPPPLPLANVYSIGDFAILVGLVVAIVSAVHRQTRTDRLDPPRANASTRLTSTSGP